MTQATVKSINLSPLTETNGQKPYAIETDELINTLPVDISVEIGTTSITLKALQSLKIGQTLALSQSLDEPVKVIVNQQVVALGTLVNVDEHYGILIQELGQ